jgi:serine/threonine protein kinase
MEDSVIGKEVDGYRIREVLGRGGMGVVYKAEDVGLSRNVALKRIDPSMANDEAFLRRFRSEAQALARIDSLYIVSVHALRETEIGLLIVMEYVEGGTVQDLIEKGPMEWQEAVPLTKQMLTALEHAHSAEVIHRDIKPQNVMLSAEGTVKVTDFGLAKVHRPDSNKTVTQGVFGTLNYMSPEQVKGSGDLDHRSDLYSLGMTVYEMLAGDLPFDEDSNEFTKMQRIVQEELPPPHELHPQVPEGLSRLVMTSLEKDPDDRFQSAREMREAFERFENERREETKQPPATVAAPPPTAAVETSAAPDEESGSPEESVSSEESSSLLSRRWSLVVGAAALVLLATGGYWLFAVEGAGGSEPSTTQLSVLTEPSGATVSLEGNPVGNTLSDTTLEGEEVRVQASLAGYEPVDTVARLEGQRKVNLRLPLTRAATSLNVQSNPRGRVSLDGREVGRTPLARTLKKDTVRVHVEREGYFPTDTLVALAGLDEANLDVQLDRRPVETDPEPEPEKAFGTLTLDASPSGTVYVDGDRQATGQSIEVLANEEHQIRIEHPQRGACDTTLTVQEEESTTLKCYFKHRVAVRSTSFANVYLNGENTGESTPHQTRLATGDTYEVGINIQRESVEIPGGRYVRRAEESDRVLEQQKFTGSTITISPQPSFEPETHGIEFQVSESEP